MAKPPSPRADHLRAMREAKFATSQARLIGRKLEAVPPADEPAAPVRPARKAKLASRKKPKA